MKINNLRIGDIVTVKGHDFPMKVVGLFGDKDVQLLPCVEDYTGDVWEEDAADLELVKPRFKLPEWVQVRGDLIKSTIDMAFCEISYEIEEFGGRYSTYLLNSNGYDTKVERVASLLTLEDAKDVAERHFNKKVERFLESINDK
ncbi:hypothetical protein [Porphyromonas gulae]|uniref:Uncharacterized protein n=1 Tax=Porphyromonas gulae TaxID=111105 RepID=A0A0A2FDA4_9PORP|nr:hypothetical protein [Porphyromonas gulae]KGN88010.1 hypothetical protein HR08_01065 [Porphyromonas gulae]